MASVNGWRYPDKPMPGTASILADLDDGWVAEPKVDGWRCLVHRTEAGVEAWTRHRKRLGEVLGRPRDLPASIQRQLEDLSLGTVLDAEWTGPRTGMEKERLFVFDFLRLDSALVGPWVGQMPRDQRRDVLEGVSLEWKAPLHLLPEGEPLAVWASVLEGRLAPWWPKRPRLVEGIVVKRRDSTLLGGRDRALENPAWLKIKLDGR